MIKRFLYIAATATAFPSLAQVKSDTPVYQLGFQQTVVTQYHPGFSAAYSGVNSLQRHEEAQTSLTTTLFAGLKLAGRTFVYFNPEIAGGAGLSKATGLAGFPNGETFRVGDPKPQVYVARLFIEHYIALKQEKSLREDDWNSIPAFIPEDHIKLVAGRFAVSDYFDNNSYSHDPRTQFLNWSLMGNGAYDYPANTRGYTYGAMAEMKVKRLKLRYAASMVPRTANASDMDPDLRNSLGQQGEAEYSFGAGRPLIVRVLGFMNRANMGNYRRAVMLGALNADTPDIVLTRRKGSIKYGLGINIEKEVSDHVGLFARAGYNDGKTETWMFTEIDNSFCAGALVKGSWWKRPGDIAGAAFVSNGISQHHRRYLEAGGAGFMVGDGALSYSRENIVELFYNMAVHGQHFFITPDYQLVINPAYNRDRGPVSIFALRVHTKF